jgi:tRNA-2-methylthio-N6-dimethylallyladenosine synthase
MKYRNITLTPEEIAVRDDSILAVAKMNSGKSLKIYINTFGCQQNEADSENVAGMSVRMGYSLTDAPESADLIVVNTCAVREHAEKKALSVIGQYKHCKKLKPSLVIAVCGCMVSQSHRADEIKMKYPYVDFTFGTSELYKFPELLKKRLKGGKREFLLPTDEPPIAEGVSAERTSDYRAWVSIMYGCNNFCSYCIVPYVRGRERSRDPEEIKTEVSELVKRGYRDITLLGQNVNSYGQKCSFECDFAKLLNDLSDIPGDYKLRFMTSHPKDATHKLVDVMAASDHIAKQFHLPAQSGSNAILKAMNRGYTIEKYLDTVDYIREKMPNVTLTSDIIVGFPGETEEDFDATLAMLKRVRFDMVYSFIYSPRKGTPAADMAGQIPENIKGERLRMLIDVQTQIAEEKNAELLGRTLRVLCFGKSKNNEDMLEGRTDGNKIVLFPGSESLEGDYVYVKITETHPFVMYVEKI